MKILKICENLRPIISCIIILATGLIGCAAREIVERNYYVLEYYQHSEKEELKQEKPLDLSVLVLDTKIPQTYDRRQIVLRHFGPKITYSDNDIWAVQLQDEIPGLITKRLNRYNIFKQVQREFLNERPDYTLSTSINNIELSESEYVRQARLNIDFYLSKGEQESYLIHHSVNREEELFDESVETFVQKINDLILEETDNFIQKTLHYFKGGKITDLVLKEEGSDTLLVKEDTPSGMGLLLLPAITRSEDEPYYKIYDKDEKEIEGKMGTPIPLPEGIYSIRYGSGSQDQMILKKEINVLPRYKRIVEPDWGCLVVDIVDEDRNFAKIRYEIFDSETGESYGSEYPAEEEIGEQQKIWVLRPGRYKVTINNESFNTYKNFTTVYLEKGKAQELTIVVDTDEEGNPTNLIGAGVLEETERQAHLQRFKFFNAVHGNVNINSDNKQDKDNSETTISLSTQLDNRLIYDQAPLHYTLKNLIELGTTKSSDIDFRISSDDINLKNTLIYYFLKNWGLYARLDMDSHLFSQNYYSSEKINYIKVDAKGNTVEKRENEEKIKVAPAFFQLSLKEGAGINLRVLNSSKANLNLRTGFGMRQDLNNNVFSFSKAEGGYDIYVEQPSEYKEGIEASAVGNFQLPFNLSYATTADVLFPFGKDESTSVEWENIFNLRLSRYVSLDYKLKLENKQPEEGKEYIVREHSLFLKVSYFLR